MIKKILWWLAVLLIAVRIFVFSAENAKVSTDTSLNVTKKIVDTAPTTKNLPEQRKTEITTQIDNTVRKYAHFSIYILLGFFVAGAMRESFGKKKASVSLAICIAYAISDETHQIFVPGRSFQITDILIDSCGSFFGIILCCLIWLAAEKIKKCITKVQ